MTRGDEEIAAAYNMTSIADWTIVATYNLALLAGIMYVILERGWSKWWLLSWVVFHIAPSKGNQ